jgi:hypothetical protein
MTYTRPIHRISIVVDSCLRVQIAHLVTATMASATS